MNGLGIGVSNLEFFNILLSYYPRETEGNFKIFFFVDNRKAILPEIKKIIKKHNINDFNNAEFIILSELYDYYVQKHGYNDREKEFLYNHGALFKILMPSYLHDKYGVTKTYSSDDDVFIFNDISYMFNKYPGYGYKKDNLFLLRTGNRFEVLKEFNEIFETQFSLEDVNRFSINSGNVISNYDEKLDYYFERFIKNKFAQHLFFDYKGYTSWTVEQRFHQFNIHRLIDLGNDYSHIKGEDLRLLLTYDKEPQEKYLKKVVPSILHYAIGKQKKQFLDGWLPGIKWRYGFVYEYQYELRS